MELPKELTTVTKTSKTLAFIVFITLPFLGFFAGMNYQASLDSASQTPSPEPILPKRIPTPTLPQTIDTSTWNIYINTKYSFMLKYPKDWIRKTNQENSTTLLSISQRPKTNSDNSILITSADPYIYITIVQKPLLVEKERFENTYKKVLLSRTSIDGKNGYISGFIQGIEGNIKTVLIGLDANNTLIIDSQNAPQMLDQILQTFQFIN